MFMSMVWMFLLVSAHIVVGEKRPGYNDNNNNNNGGFNPGQGRGGLQCYQCDIGPRLTDKMCDASQVVSCNSDQWCVKITDNSGGIERDCISAPSNREDHCVKSVDSQSSTCYCNSYLCNSSSLAMVI